MGTCAPGDSVKGISNKPDQVDYSSRYSGRRAMTGEYSGILSPIRCSPCARIRSVEARHPYDARVNGLMWLVSGLDGGSPRLAQGAVRSYFHYYPSVGRRTLRQAGKPAGRYRPELTK